jgi:hypothetical protein
MPSGSGPDELFRQSTGLSPSFNTGTALTSHQIFKLAAEVELQARGLQSVGSATRLPMAPGLFYAPLNYRARDPASADSSTRERSDDADRARHR